MHIDIKLKESLKWLIAIIVVIVVVAWLTNKPDPAPVTPVSTSPLPMYQDPAYESTFKKYFVDGCLTEGGNTSYCSCAWDELRTKFTITEIAEMGVEYGKGNNMSPATEAAFDVAVEQCI